MLVSSNEIDKNMMQPKMNKKIMRMPHNTWDSLESP